MKIIFVSIVVFILQVGVWAQTWCFPAYQNPVAIYPNTPPAVYGQSPTAVYPNTPPAIYQNPVAIYPNTPPAVYGQSLQTGKPLIVGVSVVRSSGVLLSVVGAAGVKYTLEISQDMKTWNNGGEVLIDTSGQGTAKIPFQSGRQFFRIRAG